MLSELPGVRCGLADNQFGSRSVIQNATNAIQPDRDIVTGIANIDRGLDRKCD